MTARPHRREAGLLHLLEDGWFSIQVHIGRTHCGTVSGAGRPALDQSGVYLANHRHRIACGEPIGSGLIEDLQTSHREPARSRG